MYEKLKIVKYNEPFGAGPWVYYYVQKLCRMTNIELKRIDSVTRSPLYAQIGESLTGMATIRAYREEGRFVAVNRETAICSCQPRANRRQYRSILHHECRGPLA